MNSDNPYNLSDFNKKVIAKQSTYLNLYPLCIFEQRELEKATGDNSRDVTLVLEGEGRYVLQTRAHATDNERQQITANKPVDSTDNHSQQTSAHKLTTTDNRFMHTRQNDP